MAKAIPRYRTRGVKAACGPWYGFSTDRIPDYTLISTWAIGPIGVFAIPMARSEQLESLLEMCPLCRGWDRAKRRSPIDVTLRTETYGGKPVTRQTLRTRWVDMVIGSPIPIIHMRLLEALGKDAPDRWLLGRVQLADGSVVDELRSVIDPWSIELRHVYRPTSFRHYGSARIEPCVECGRFVCSGFSSTWYTTEHEVTTKGVSISNWGHVLLPKRLVDGLGLYDRRTWNTGRLTKIEVFERAVDPLPSPLPVWWEEFEQYEASFGNRLPSRYVATLVWLTRIRALWEPRVARAIDGMTDGQVQELLDEKEREMSRAGKHFDFGKAF